MNVGDTIKPSFGMDQAGIEKDIGYKVIEIDNDYAYIKTDLNLILPVHKNKIVELDVFNADLKNYLSKTWLHVSDV